MSSPNVIDVKHNVTNLVVSALLTQLCVQLAEEQAQSLAASEAAEERIQALEQRLASHAQATTAQPSAGRDPPAMAAPGAPSLSYFLWCAFNTVQLICIADTKAQIRI